MSGGRREREVGITRRGEEPVCSIANPQPTAFVSITITKDAELDALECCQGYRFDYRSGQSGQEEQNKGDEEEDG